MKRMLPMIVLVACFSGYAGQHRPSVMAGFGKGKDYLDMSANDKRVYAMGAIDGMLVAPLLGAPRKQVDWLEKCVPQMTDEQVAAILTKYIREHPGE